MAVIEVSAGDLSTSKRILLSHYSASLAEFSRRSFWCKRHFSYLPIVQLHQQQPMASGKFAIELAMEALAQQGVLSGNDAPDSVSQDAGLCAAGAALAM